MAKLPTTVQEAAGKADASTGFQPLPAGFYRFRITSCHLSVPQKAGDGHNAVWELVADQDGVRKTKLTHRVSHDPGAAGLMKAVFMAAGLTLDSDEEEFVGEHVLLDLLVEEQEQGRNKGKLVNRINAVLPVGGAVASANGASGSAPATATAATAGTGTEDPWA